MQPTIPFEIGSKVLTSIFDHDTKKIVYLDQGYVVAGYTYWGTGFSILTIDSDGVEREFINGFGLEREDYA